jgi:hypothetical protein
MARRKKQDENLSSENENQNDDTFGLPEIEYQPLNREETPDTTTTTTETYYQSTSNTTETPKEMEQEEVRQDPQYNSNAYYDNDDDGGSPWPKILGIAALLIFAGAAVWYFAMYRPGQLAAERAEKERIELEAKQKEQELLAEQKRQEDERRRADSLSALSATPPPGTIETLTERTGRYYVIVASGIDGDLIKDYAEKLAPKGLSPKIIPPYGKVKFYRLAIADGDTYASTQATADQVKSEYADGAWVVKY